MTTLLFFTLIIITVSALTIFTTYHMIKAAFEYNMDQFTNEIKYQQISLKGKFRGLKAEM